MGRYNAVFAQTPDDNEPATLESLCRIFSGSIRRGDENAARAVSRNSKREMFLEVLRGLISDTDCLNRVINRIGIDQEDWSKVSISQALVAKFAERLACNKILDWRGMFRLQHLIHSSYWNGNRFIEILPFRQEYQDNMIAIRGALKKAAEQEITHQTRKEPEDKELIPERYIRKYRDLVGRDILRQLFKEYAEADFSFQPIRGEFTEATRDTMYMAIDKSALLSPQEKIEGMVGLAMFLDGSFPKPPIMSHLEKVFGKKFMESVEVFGKKFIELVEKKRRESGLDT
jgi:hypothetical protein